MPPKKRLSHKKSTKDRLKKRYTFMRSLKRSKKPKSKKKLRRAGLNKEDASKYIGLLNEALKQMYQGEMLRDLFTKDILWTSGYLEIGMENGYRLMKEGNFQLDPSCNIVCLSNALLILTMIEQDYDELSDLQKLYLFFLHYFNRSGNDKSRKILPLAYALKKVDKEFEIATEYYQKKVAEKAKSKSIKTALKSIGKIEVRREGIKKIYRNYHDSSASGWSGPYTDDAEEDEDGNPQEYWINETGEFAYTDPALRYGQPPKNISVNICGDIDCLYLNEEVFIENPKLEKPLQEFCDHLILIFKGIIWLLMKEFSESQIYMYNIQSGGGNYWCDHHDCLDSVEEFETEEELEKHKNEVHDKESKSDSKSEIKYENKIELDLSIHILLQNTDCVLIPTNSIFYDDDTYKSGESLQKGDEWVYTNFRKIGPPRKRSYKMDKVLVRDLKDKFYLTATIFDSGFMDLEYLTEFMEGKMMPKLTKIEIIEQKLPNGTNIPQLREEIVNSITQHWYVAPKKEIYDNVVIQMAI